MVQVTPVSVRLVDCETFSLLDEYTPDGKSITVASGNLIQIAIATTGGELLCFEVDSASKKLRQVSSAILDQDVACLSLRPQSSAEGGEVDMEVDAESSDYESTATSLSASRSAIIVVGMWTDNTARILSLPTLDELCRVSLGTDIQVRDVLVVEMGGKLFMMVGVGDGHLFTYSVDLNSTASGGSGVPILSNKRKGALGTHSISFTCFYNAGELCVFAACDRPTVIYSRNGKLLFSAVNTTKGEIVSMSPFHSELFPECLAMVGQSSLLIGTIEDIQKIHIQTVPLDGDAPRRIAHNGSVGVYGGEFLCACAMNIVDVSRLFRVWQ